MNRSQFTSYMRAVAGVLFVASFAFPASAQSAGSNTVLTFKGPVRLPGITLAAGTYEFQRVESDRDVRSIQVFSVKPRRLVTTLRTSPITRQGGGDNVIFRQTAAGATPAVAALYVGGSTEGAEFIYSGDERKQLTATSPIATPAPAAAVPAVPAPPPVEVTR
jgi:hypothetical protein